MRIFQYSLLVLVSVFLIECATPPEYPIEPRIEFVSFSKDTLIGDPNSFDFVSLRFSFTDGDRDFGNPVNDNERNVFIIDSRNQDTLIGYSTPEIPDLGASDAISGEVKIDIPTDCCLYPPFFSCETPFPVEPPFDYDSLTYTIFVKDRAGNLSNEIVTPPIYYECL